MSIEILKQEDYDVNLQYVLEQFKGSEKLISILRAFNAEMNKVETCLFEIRDNYYLSTAVGVQLDVLGIIFNEGRGGRSNDEYRASLYIVAAQSYSGTPEHLYAQLRSLYGATSSQYTLGDVSENAVFIMNTDSLITLDNLAEISPAGVGASLGAVLILENGDFLVFENGDYIKTTTTF